MTIHSGTEKVNELISTATAGLVTLTAVKSDTDIADAISKKHDGATQDTAIQEKTTLSAVKSDSDVASAVSLKHSNSLDHNHSNKSTLDTYDQTNANLTDAVSKKHSNSLDHSQNTDTGTSASTFSINGNNAIKEGDSRLTDARTPTTHSHAESDITNLTTDLSGKAATSHSHSEGDITNLTTDLAAKDTPSARDTAISSHASLTATHGVAGTIASIANIATHAALTATHGVAGTIAGLADIATHAALTATHGVAGTIAGLADIATHAALTTGVHGVGAGTIAKTSDITASAVGLSNCNNTSDANKPVSTAQQTALDLKANLISPSLTTPALGTPSAGVLTNCTGTASGLTAGSATTVTGEVPNTNIPCGINNGNSASQSQVVVAGTYYYITKSDIDLPATPIAGMKVGTRFVWQVAMTKTAAGTAGFSICIYRGTNATVADTRDVTQSVGVSTAVVDSMVVDVQVTVTATGASGSYYWSIIPVNKAVTATGFGVATGATGFFSGTVSSVAMNTASLKFGLGFMQTTGTPTIVIPFVNAQAFNMD